MKLLFITRKIDNLDKQAGFVTDWIFEFAKNVDRLYIVCQELGEISDLPENIEIYSLGKENNKNKFFQILTFYFYFFKLLFKIDGVFSHMIHHYSILVGPWCRLFNKKLIQWYVHKSTPVTLKIASWFVNGFVTVNKESFRLDTKKNIYMFGHGINTDKYKKNLSSRAERGIPSDKTQSFKILTIGRISPVKNIDVMISAIKEIKFNFPEYKNKFFLQIVGGPGLTSQATYMKELEKTVTENNLNSVIDFIGPLPQAETLSYYENCDLFLNLSETGSVDKVVLEAMAFEKLVLTSNEAFKAILPQKLFIQENDYKLLAQKIIDLYNLPQTEKESISRDLRKEVVKNHNLGNLVERIISLYK